MKRLLLFMATAAMFFVSCDLLEDIIPALDLDKDSVSLVAEGAEATFTITSNQDWTASADQTWVKIDPASGEASDESVTVTVTADDNPDLEARTATITVTAGELTKTVAVTQAAGESAPDYSLVVDKTELEFVAEGAEATFTVTSNQDWTASADQDWVELTPAAGEASDEAVAVRVITTANELLEARTATITVTAGELTKTVAVTQAAGEPAPEEYVLDGKQWVFEWLHGTPAFFDFGVTEAGKFYVAVSEEDMWSPYYEGTYSIKAGENNTGVVNLVFVDSYSGTELPVEMPYTMTAADAVTFDTSALESLLSVTSVSATLASEKLTLTIYEFVEAVYFAADYFGGMSSSYNYQFALCDMEVSGEDLPAGSKFYSIDFYSDVPVGDGPKVLPEGEYLFDPDSTGEPGTFSAESYDLSDGKELAILDGYVVIYDDGAELYLVLENNSIHYVEYYGTTSFGSSAPNDAVSTLEGDLEIASENGYVIAETYGDELGIGMNYWYINAVTEDGDMMFIELLSDGGLAGDYPVFDENADEYAKGFIPGDYEAEVEDGEIYIYPLYTWWLETELVGEDLVMTGGAPIIDGELRITETEGVYTFEFDFYDDMGNNIVGSISGEGDIYDESEPAASMTKAPAKTPIVLKKK